MAFKTKSHLLQLIFVLITLDYQRRPEYTPAEQQLRLRKSFVWNSNHFRKELQYIEKKQENIEFFVQLILNTQVHICLGILYRFICKFIIYIQNQYSVNPILSIFGKNNPIWYSSTYLKSRSDRAPLRDTEEPNMGLYRLYMKFFQ